MTKYLLPFIFMALIASFNLHAQDPELTEDASTEEEVSAEDGATTSEDEPADEGFTFDEEPPAEDDDTFGDDESSSGGGWGTSDGSCNVKGDKHVSLSMPVWPIGFFSAFDYNFHDCISGGGGLGIYGYNFSSLWRYHYMPIIVRGAFHPFNLSVLADKIKVRDKLDVYVGIATGVRIGWVSWKGSGNALPEPSITAFVFREYIGIKFYPTDNFYLYAEEGGGLPAFSIGVGLKF